MAQLWQFRQGHTKPAFSEKVQRGDEEKFFKNHPKSSRCLKGWEALLCKLNYTLIKMHLKCKEWRRFWRKQRLQNCPNNQVMAILARSPKTRIFWRSAKGDQGKFFKNRPKSSLRFKGLKALWRKCHYPRTTMHLKRKDWKRLWRRRLLQKCPNGRVIAIFGRSP